MTSINWNSYCPHPIALMLWTVGDVTFIGKMDASGELHGCRDIHRTDENYDECINAWIATEHDERGLKLYDLRSDNAQAMLTERRNFLQGIYYSRPEEWRSSLAGQNVREQMDAIDNVLSTLDGGYR